LKQAEAGFAIADVGAARTWLVLRSSSRQRWKQHEATIRALTSTLVDRPASVTVTFDRRAVIVAAAQLVTGSDICVDYGPDEFVGRVNPKDRLAF
jgi:hypothetical protein